MRIQKRQGRIAGVVREFITDFTDADPFVSQRTTGCDGSGTFARGNIYLSKQEEENMKVKEYIVISAAFFGAVAAVHLLRVMFRLPVQVAGVEIPVWLSWIALTATGVLSAWGFSSSRKN